MKLKKRVKDLIESLYNQNKDLIYTADFNLVNGLSELAETYPDEFSFTHEANIVSTRGTFRREYLFKIKRLGYMPDFLKGNS